METLMGMEFTAYVGLAVLLFAIRQATGIHNRYIPISAVVLGISFAMFEYKDFTFDIFLIGLKYALYGVGTVATIKYTLTKTDKGNPRAAE